MTLTVKMSPSTPLPILLFLTLTVPVIVFGNEADEYPTLVLPGNLGSPYLLQFVDKYIDVQPRHVHIAFGADPSTQVTITWSTVDALSSAPFAEFGKDYGLRSGRVEGTSTLFQDTGELLLTQYIHRVELSALKPNTSYLYHVGSIEGISPIFQFRTPPDHPNWSPRLAVYGDLGNVNGQSLFRLQEEVQRGEYDALIHVGDFAYDMDTDNGLVGDAFMAQIEPIAAYLPYMTCPGNHEGRDNFLHYRNRFTMPSVPEYKEQMMYSFDLGPAHFISISTEAYYFLQYGLKPVVQQFDWLVKDLQEANKRRDERPWIIVFGHRPMYCSNNNTDDCTRRETRVRVGIPFLGIFGLEDLFMQEGVDLAIWAHEHSYERMWPLYNFQVRNSSTIGEPYRNPKALVHVTTGSAGCKERHDDFLDYVPPFTAFRSTDYGYSRLNILNRTHLYFEQVSDDQGGQVVDSFTLIRERHEPYSIADVPSRTRRFRG